MQLESQVFARALVTLVLLVSAWSCGLFPSAPRCDTALQLSGPTAAHVGDTVVFSGTENQRLPHDYCYRGPAAVNFTSSDSTVLKMVGWNLGSESFLAVAPGRVVVSEDGTPWQEVTVTR